MKYEDDDSDTDTVEVVYGQDPTYSAVSTVSASTKSTLEDDDSHDGELYTSKEKENAKDCKSTVAKKKSNKLGIGSFAIIAIMGSSGYAFWRYGLGSPTTFSETKESFQDLWEAARNITLDDFKDVLENGLDGLDFGSLFDNDPRVGDNNTYVWREEYIHPDEGGLHLMLLNALDDTWQDEFYDAVADWKDSTALDLETQRVEVDHNCTRVDGVMVVCNANFGDTGWVGINENELWDNVIYSSVAKMNEYYLRNSNYAHRRYTMCHEIGHGFGLPHTDENPYNSDKGNCLDYTTTPQNNLYPGKVNYQRLHGMYNLYSGRRLRRELEDGRVIETSILYVDESAAERGFHESE